ncbi:DUF1203 domain-containing protein [Streptomyces sp. MBT49]|uniref:DUF1203 domain-containing protein n=1 Tax=unclassified Streptomyces TaxID=2593676 RepID=UPI00190D7BC6|nr:MULTISPECIES: DUF1203 domain-containing protein [unclassified Streptomyces]MBK3630051.1 DUF1203 domain-containing protein [Streptomyces sp. MBT49]MBK3634885.1 DUF1203 domain-containing protein [Streptomyces sp. MBT97]
MTTQADTPAPTTTGTAVTRTAVTRTARPVPADVLDELRRADDAGRPPVPVTDEEGGAPLRCCLRRSEPGESIVLVSYAPLRRWAAATGADPGPYDEQGPVFVHARKCAGPAGAELPFTGSRRVVRRYSAAGHILGGRLVEDPDGFDAAFAEAFADPEVSLVHVRAVEYGCFLYEVRRG